jgi:integrase
MRIVWFRGKWHAYERVDGKPRRISLGTTDRKVADRRLIDLQQGRRRNATTVAQMYEDYVSDRGSRIASIQTVHFAWKRLAPVFGHLRPDQITRVLTRAYATHERQRHISDGSIRRDLGVLGAIVRHNDKRSPAVIEMPPAPPPKSRHLTREQYRELRDEAKRTAHLYLFVVLAYRTGGRASAILELTWDRVDFTRGQIRLGLGEQRAKGRATVPMAHDTAEILQEYHKGALIRLRDRIRWPTFGFSQAGLRASCAARRCALVHSACPPSHSRRAHGRERRADGRDRAVPRP